MVSDKTRRSDPGLQIADDASVNEPEWIEDLRGHYGCGDSLPDPEVLEPGEYANYVEAIDEAIVHWRRTGVGDYEARIGTWSFSVVPPTGDGPAGGKWMVEATHHSVYACNYTYTGSFDEAEQFARSCAKLLYDFRGFERFSPKLLSQVLFNEAALGIGWDEAEPDTSDERYRRCLVAAGAALDDLWDVNAPLQPGQPLGPPVASISDIFGLVYSFAYDKLCEYYSACGDVPDFGLVSRRCRASARRATASLLGEAAMGEAESQYDRARAEWASSLDAEREARKDQPNTPSSASR
ncbi:hypothetical protein [Tautonia plasticadhaerens]|uniref:Uncharacterized protein n=1 Tax=Tautonia plasticadhaerens TaxID=2527974 RepID=A0A518H7Y9_9BACT|nr:hypothetical protein [Tautonia plasticadhaerens]QDV36901.1 hypothetical protein ElP_48310 [Tautonia plasticadhaerens]